MSDLSLDEQVARELQAQEHGLRRRRSSAAQPVRPYDLPAERKRRGRPPKDVSGSSNEETTPHRVRNQRTQSVSSSASSIVLSPRAAFSRESSPRSSAGSWSASGSPPPSRRGSSSSSSSKTQRLRVGLPPVHAIPLALDLSKSALSNSFCQACGTRMATDDAKQQPAASEPTTPSSESGAATGATAPAAPAPAASSSSTLLNAFNCASCVALYNLPRTPLAKPLAPLKPATLSLLDCSDSAFRASPAHRCLAPSCHLTFLSSAALRRHTLRIHSPEQGAAGGSSPLLTTPASPTAAAPPPAAATTMVEGL